MPHPHMDKIISWNVRGINAPDKQEDIKVFLQQEHAGMVETKVKETNIQHVMSKVCANWNWEHNATKTERGRIILSWHPRKYHFGLILKKDQLLHGEVKHLPTNRNFFVTLVYRRIWKIREYLYGRT